MLLLPQHVQQRPLPVRKGLPLRLTLQRPYLPVLIPQANGQDRMQRVIKGAEVSLAHPQPQPDLLPGELRRFVQQRLYRLQRPVRQSGFHGQHHPLRAAVSPSKGHGDPHPGANLHAIGHQVVIRLVYGKGSRFYCDFGDLRHGVSLLQRVVTYRCRSPCQWWMRRTGPRPPR